MLRYIFFLLSLFSLLSLDLFGQDDLSQNIRNYRAQIGLTDKKLDKLEKIRTNFGLDENERTDKWMKLLEKYGIALEMSELDLYPWLNSNTYEESSLHTGVSTEYYRVRIQELVELNRISDEDLKFLNNALLIVHPYTPRSAVRNDIENIIELFDLQDEYAFSNDELHRIGAFFRSSSFKRIESFSELLEVIRNSDDSLMEELNEHMLSRGIRHYKFSYPHVDGKIDSDVKDIASVYGHVQKTQPGLEMYNICAKLLSIYWWHPEHSKEWKLIEMFKDWTPSDFERFREFTWRGEVKDAIVGHIMLQKWSNYLEKKFNASPAGIALASVLNDNSWEQMRQIESNLMVHGLFNEAVDLDEYEMSVFELYKLMHSGVYYYPLLNAEQIRQLQGFDFSLFGLTETEALLLSKVQPDYTRSLKGHQPPSNFGKSNLEPLNFRFALYLAHVNAAYATTAGVYYSKDYDLEDVDDDLPFVNKEFSSIRDLRIDSAYQVCYDRLNELLRYPKEKLFVVHDGLGGIVTGEVSDTIRQEIRDYLEQNFPLQSMGVDYVRFVFGQERTASLFVGPHLTEAKPTPEIISFATEVPPAPQYVPQPYRSPVVEEVIDFPEVEASFPGGVEAMQKYIAENVVYPKKALKKGESGKVFVRFTVTENGDVDDVKIIRGVSLELDKEALRVVKSMPAWSPAEKNGKKVSTRVSLPIIFAL
jgi:TonB family protein